MENFQLTYELKALLASVGLLFAITVFQAVNGLFKYGIRQIVGMREDIPFPAPGVSGRANRALVNHMEALAMFTPVILTATITGVSTIVTLWAAKIFFMARLLHAVVYLLGIPWVRTFAFAIGVMSIFAIVFEILKGVS